MIFDALLLHIDLVQYLSMKSDGKFCTEKEAADLLGLKSQTLAKWRCKETNTKLKYVKIGGAIRYIKANIEKFLADNTVGID